MKAVEDRDSFSCSAEAVEASRVVDASLRPRNEDAEPLERYYAIVRNLYTSQPSYAAYGNMWRLFGAAQEVTDAIVAESRLLADDAVMFANVVGVYPKVLTSLRLQAPRV